MKINKLTILIPLLLVLASINTNAQPTDIDVPKIVVDAFNDRFPAAIAARWEKEKNTVYEVSFIINNNKFEATYTAVGRLIKVEKLISFNTLPAAVKNSFKKKFPNVKVTEASEVESAKNGSLFGVEFDNGTQVKEVFFNTKGEIILLEEENFKE